MSDHYEFEGKTVDDAVAKGLIDLGLSKEQVTVHVVRKGSRGLFGIGSESALVQLIPQVTNSSDEYEAPDLVASKHYEPVATDSSTLTSAAVDEEEYTATNRSSEAVAAASESETEFTDESEAVDSYQADDDSWFEDEDLNDVDKEVATTAIHYLEEILDLMGFEGEVNATWQEPEPDESDSCLLLTVEGENLGTLIGRRGETMDSLQYLLRLMLNQKVRAWRNIVIDIGGYKAKRSKQLNQLALRMADQVVESGRAMSLEPMPANERRIVHLALRDHPDVYTESSGETNRRKVHIIPKSLL